MRIATPQSDFLTSNEIGDIIKRRGLGWWARYAQYADKPDQPKVYRHGSGLALFASPLPANESPVLHVGVNGNENVIRHRLTTEDENRNRDVWVAAGMNPSEYNGVSLWCHNSYEPNIGKILKFYLTKTARGVPCIDGDRFYHRETDLSDDCYRMDVKGCLPSSSVGMDPTQYEVIQHSDGDNGTRFIAWNFLEDSACNIPLNPWASNHVAAWEPYLRAGVERQAIRSDGALARWFSSPVRVADLSINPIAQGVVPFVREEDAMDLSDQFASFKQQITDEIRSLLTSLGVNMTKPELIAAAELKLAAAKTDAEKAAAQAELEAAKKAPDKEPDADDKKPLHPDVVASVNMIRQACNKIAALHTANGGTWPAIDEGQSASGAAPERTAAEKELDAFRAEITTEIAAQKATLQTILDRLPAPAPEPKPEDGVSISELLKA